jgi:hypothetical protein
MYTAQKAQEIPGVKYPVKNTPLGTGSQRHPTAQILFKKMLEVKFLTSTTAPTYGWTGQQSGSGFINLTPSILHYNWF